MRFRPLFFSSHPNWQWHSALAARYPMWLLVLGMVGCQLYEATPYGARIAHASHRDLHAYYLAQLQSMDSGAADFSIALLADTHQHLDELRDAVAHIAEQDEIDFILVVGDFTKFGLLQEFDWFRQVMTASPKPYLTAIGNHECVADGVDIYRTMFGPLDYNFTYKGYQFVVANTNGWHFPGAPDFDVLEGGLAAGTTACYGEPCRATVVFSHIPPWKDQFTSAEEERYVHLMQEYGVLLSVHGHTHSFAHKENYRDLGTDYLVVDDVHSRSYVRLDMQGDRYSYVIQNF